MRGVWWTKAAARSPHDRDRDAPLVGSSDRKTQGGNVGRNFSRWHLDYDPLDPQGLQPADYAAAAAEIRRFQAA